MSADAKGDILGDGASGTVVRKWKECKFVAEKTICTKSAYMRRAAIRECTLLLELNHPNIIRAIGFCVTHDAVVLDMELGGEELFRHVQTLHNPQRVFTQLCYGVCYLHDNRVAHRDLKLENVVIDIFGHVRIVDFGYADRFTDTAMSSRMMGSTSYCAPEVWLGKDYDVFKADVWALGIILFGLAYKAFPVRVSTAQDPGFCQVHEAQANGMKPMDSILHVHPRLVPVEWARAGLDATLAVCPDARAHARALV